MSRRIWWCIIIKYKEKLSKNKMKKENEKDNLQEIQKVVQRNKNNYIDRSKIVI